MIYESDYSVIYRHPTDGEVLRSYEKMGNKHAWPIELKNGNGNNYTKVKTKVDDYGQHESINWQQNRSHPIVDWAWGSLGCDAYANFLAQSVHSTRGDIVLGTSGIVVDCKINENNDGRLFMTIDNLDNFKDYMKLHADPEEIMRYHYEKRNKSPQHTLIFLAFGEEEINGVLKEGFYYCDYQGGRKTEHDKYGIGFYSYDAFLSQK